MSLVSAIVLYLVIWFMVLFVVLPLRLETQGEQGEVVPGTHEGAPANPRMWRKARIVTVAAAAIWVVIAGVIFSGWISVRDLDFFDRMRPPASETGG